MKTRLETRIIWVERGYRQGERDNIPTTLGLNLRTVKFLRVGSAIFSSMSSTLARFMR